MIIPRHRAVSRRDGGLKKKHVCLTTSASLRSIFLGYQTWQFYLYCCCPRVPTKVYKLYGNGIREKKKEHDHNPTCAERWWSEKETCLLFYSCNFTVPGWKNRPAPEERSIFSGSNMGVKHGNSIYIVVVLEYLAAKDYEFDGNRIRDKKKNIHTPTCATSYRKERIHRYIKKGQYSRLIRTGNPVYMAAILEYLAAQKGVVGRRCGHLEKKHVSWSTRAGLQYLIERIHRYVNKDRYSQGVRTSDPAFMAAILEYFVPKVLEFARKAIRDNKEEQDHTPTCVKLLATVTTPHGGRLLKTKLVLLPKENEKAAVKEPAKTIENSAVSKRDGSLKKKHVSLSTSTSLRFLMRIIGHHLKKGRYLQGIKHGNSIYIVVVLERLATKDYELDGNGIRDKRRT
ncbi:hypothetical protein M9H77_29757 [Catharanthus roseus]|uniref:Uncharacterized protein n=1 Tax=Catharanthus roseus TaxID=4058 RepID=A0ACB9ZVC6_CATRO|nr:hypothetical protein M9H77_29757 [Catharanthus roseus]